MTKNKSENRSIAVARCSAYVAKPTYRYLIMILPFIHMYLFLQSVDIKELSSVLTKIYMLGSISNIQILFKMKVSALCIHPSFIIIDLLIILVSSAVHYSFSFKYHTNTSSLLMPHISKAGNFSLRQG